jgi:predicted acyl esterase
MNIRIEKSVPVTMCDGVNLFADVYRPGSSVEYQVQLTRLPYNKALPVPEVCSDFLRKSLRRWQRA